MKQNLDQYIADNLQSAVLENCIRPFYQPVIRTISRKLCGFEALARWIDPVRGMIRPDQFIPVLEKNRTVHLLDECIIRQVCARLRAVLDAGEIPIPVSVNLSRLDFFLCDVFEMVDGIATHYQLPHDYLRVEITESTMADDEKLLRKVVDRFRSAGYQVWMDDFGSGYSSLNSLKDFSFDELKLDMHFLSSFNLRSRRILTSVIHMAKEIGIHTLAEGVETEEQFSYLRNIGCEKVQGYYFGRPMPYDEIMDHIRRTGICTELPQDRKYYDDIGKVNLLSAAPFMSQKERDSLTGASQLNSIPLAISEVHKDYFCILYYNTAFEEMARGTGLIANIFTQELLGKPQPFTRISGRVLSLVDSLRSRDEGQMYFISNGDYYEAQTKCIARSKDAYSALFRISNLSKASKALETDLLDNALRQVYSLFERITLIDLKKDEISPLYVTTRTDLVSGHSNVRALGEEYARSWIFPDDRKSFLTHMDLDTLEDRLQKSGRTYLCRSFRSRIHHGEYAWKQHILQRLGDGIYLLLIHNLYPEELPFGDTASGERIRKEVDQFLPSGLLWENLVNSDMLRIFWKDRDRRFLGASRAFLDYYGFKSEEEILGKSDEELGWHIRPDKYMNDEVLVINEGLTTINVPGHCIRAGENRDILASKKPIYDENGEIRGLMGYFIDTDLLTANDSRGIETKRRDMMTGLLNARGLQEEANAFRDEYFLRNADFARINVSVEDFISLISQYGHGFGDKVLIELGKALKRLFGQSSAVGRYSGHQFVIFRQAKPPAESNSLPTESCGAGSENCSHADMEKMHARIRAAAAEIREIDGTPLTLYLSIGCALFSESEDLEEQAKTAQIRLLADHGGNAPSEHRSARAQELFHLYENLPIPYVVYHTVTDVNEKVTDAVVFYVNRRFCEMLGKPAGELLGKRVRTLFPALKDEWFDIAQRAALFNETVIEPRFTNEGEKIFHLTASPVIRRGYCAFTYQKAGEVQ